MPPYTLQQRIFIYDSYVITSSCREVVRRFQANYPGVRVPSREAVRLLVNKLRETGSILDKKRIVKRRVLTKQKLEEIGGRLENSPLKSLRRLAQETDISRASAWKATKLEYTRVARSKYWPRLHALPPSKSYSKLTVVIKVEQFW